MRLPGYRKYRNKPTYVGKVRFASRKEANRYCDLLILETAGKISNLRRQVRHTFRHNGVLIGAYVSDFEYTDVETGHDVTEDVKGYKKNPVYRLKRRLMLAFEGITIVEV